jgi:hypothetical protein
MILYCAYNFVKNLLAKIKEDANCEMDST